MPGRFISSPQRQRETGGEHRIDYSRCVSCGACVFVCPAQCLELVGRQYTAEELTEELLLDLPFWGGGGGVTFSGGEPLSQAEFVLRCAGHLKGKGVHLAVETSGYAPLKKVRLLEGVIDQWLYDFKAADGTKHRKLCGQDSAPIRANFQWLFHRGKRLILRYPVVPGINDAQEDLDALSRLLFETSPAIPVELLPYHRMEKSKAERIGQSYPAVLPERDAAWADVERVQQALLALGLADVRIMA